MQMIRSIFCEANVEISFFITDIKDIFHFCEKIFSEMVCSKFTYDIRRLGCCFSFVWLLFIRGESALCLTHSQSLISMFASIILRTFSSVSSALSAALFVGSSTPDIIRHNLREYCFNLSTCIFSNSLVFVAIKLQDYASRSICSRLATRLINLSILLSWILIISRRSLTFGLKEEVVLAYGVDNGVSDSIVVGVDEVDFGIKGGVDSFLAFNSCLKPPSYSSRQE